MSSKTLRSLLPRLSKLIDRLAHAEQRTAQADARATAQAATPTHIDALRDFTKAGRQLAKIRRQVVGMARQIRNAVVIKTARKRPVKCPVCHVNYSTWTAVVKHLAEAHEWRERGSNHYYRCNCGRKSGSARKMAAHLSGQKDLDMHVALGVVAGRNGLQ